MTKRILAISSGGGHWEQLMIISPSFEGYDVVYANTIPGLAERTNIKSAHIVPDCNRDRKFDNIKSAWAVFRLVVTTRPDLVVTTGAAPGLFGLVFGRLIGAKTIWIDSVANSEKLSLSGKLAGNIAHLWLTQWEHLARPNGPLYMGSVL